MSETATKPTLRQRQEAEAKRMMCAAWVDNFGPIRIMAIAGGYAMVRRPGGMPFVELIREFGKRYQIDDAAGRAGLAATTQGEAP